jgi:hypothetical protein
VPLVTNGNASPDDSGSAGIHVLLEHSLAQSS